MPSPVLHSRPWLTAEDREALVSAMQTRMVAQGERTRGFERSLAAWVGAADGVAVGSGTAALDLALEALDVTDGDHVVLPSYVCGSVMGAVVARGAVPVLCDVGREWVVTPDEVAARLGPRTRAIVVPHMYGIFADVAAFRRFGVPVVEDCAQAIGAPGARPISGDVAIFSFHPTKCLTTGEGGMALSNRPRLVERMRELRDGSDRGVRGRRFSPMSDLQGALGQSQLTRYERGLARRRQIADRYRSLLASLAPDSLPESIFAKTMFFRFPIRLSGGTEVHAPGFAERGVIVRKGVDRLLHRILGLADADFPVSVSLFETTVSLPIYPALTDAELARCLEAARAVLGVAPSATRGQRAPDARC